MKIFTVKETLGHVVQGSDDEIGPVADVYFDDVNWVVRYFMIDASEWLDSRAALVSPAQFASVNWEERTVRVNITREQIRRAPNFDTAGPISRTMEGDFYKYYGVPVYWGGDAIWGPGMTPGALAAAAVAASAEQAALDNAAPNPPEESHLQRASTTFGFALRARDGDIGHLEDLVFDEESFRINYLVVDTGGWLGSKKVIIPPSWVKDVEWDSGTIPVDLSRETIKNSPEFDLEALKSSEP